MSRDPSFASVCSDFRRSGLLDRSNVLNALKLEGYKRVESFLFEKLFERLADRCVTGSSGWLFQLSRTEAPHHWFRLETKASPWMEECDGPLVSMLAERGYEVVRIRLSDNGDAFLASRRSGQRWSPFESLEDVLSTITGRSSPAGSLPDPYNKHSRQEDAIRFIDYYFSDAELTDLGAGRILVNCYLRPWYDRQPVDIDRVIQTEDGFRLLEFKRKYPARSKTFGIDEHPHGTLIDWLDDAGHPLLHVILVDPLWDKTVSPLHLLTEGSVTRKHAMWVGFELDRNSFTGNGFRTHGRDSGMSGGNRGQREIRAGEAVLLGSGVDPPELCRFLRSPSSLFTEDLTGRMVEARRRAKAARREEQNGV